MQSFSLVAKSVSDRTGATGLTHVSKVFEYIVTIAIPTGQRGVRGGCWCGIVDGSY